MNLKHSKSFTLFFLTDTKDEGLAYIDELRNGPHGTKGWVYHGVRGGRHAFTADLVNPVEFVTGVVERVE